MLILSSALITLAAAVATPTATDIAARIASADSLCGSARLTVSMPQLPNDIVYDIDFSQRPTSPGDTLAPTDYLIEWQADRGGRVMKGFSAYFSGNHFRYSGSDKIQEYHMEADAVPFNPRGKPRAEGGVQRNAQFVDILPAFIAERLAADAAEGRNHVAVHADTMVDGRRVAVVDVETILPGGSTGRESEYVLDRQSMLPLRVTQENSPGTISEQTLTVNYSYPSPATCPGAIDEPTLIARWPEEFASFRRSNFRIEQLQGRQLPPFSSPTPTGERYTRASADEHLAAPTVVALMESGQTFNDATVGAIRRAIDNLPFAANAIFAYTDSHAQTMEEETGLLRPGETLLMSARGLARDCGAAMMPTLLLVDRSGRVAEIIIGFNNDLASDVIQKLTLINQ